MTTPRPTHEDGIAAAEAIARTHGIDWADLRRVAADHLSTDWPEHEGMGSSDVSCHLSYLGNYEPAVLEQGAQDIKDRRRIVASLVDSTGKTEAQVLADLRAFFAPAT